MADRQEILTALSAPAVSMRLWAIDQASQAAADPTLRQALQARLEIEPDPECQQYLHLALACQEGPDPATAGTDFDAPGWQVNWTTASPPQRQAMLAALTSVQAAELGPLGPTLVSDPGSDPALTALLLRALRRHWPADQVESLVPLLRAASLSLRLSALSALVERAPALLQRELPNLLREDEPRVRALAIRGLAAIDLPEAVAHFGALLASRDRHDILAALQIAFQLPYPEIKPHILRFLAASRDEDLLQRAGTLLLINHELDVPFHLVDLAASSAPPKARILRSLLQEACQIIERSGADRERVRRCFERLQAWSRERGALHTLNQLLAQVPAEGEPDPSLAEALRQLLGTPAMRAAAMRTRQRPLPEAAATLLDRLLAEPAPTATAAPATAPVPPAPATLATPVVPATATARPAAPTTPETAAQAAAAATAAAAAAAPPTKPPAPPPPADGAEDLILADDGPTDSHPGDAGLDLAVAVPRLEDLRALTPEARLRTIASWQAEDREAAEPVLLALMRASDATSDLCATGLRAATRLGLEDLVAEAEAWLKSPDGKLAASALAYLAEVDPDRIVHLLPRFVQSSDRSLKQAAVAVLDRIDPQAAVSQLCGLLTARGQQQQLQALRCLVRFDFKLVRDPLTRYLSNKPCPEALEIGLGLFAANPDPENLASLVALEGAVASEDAKTVANVRHEGEQQLVALGVLEKGQLNARLEAAKSGQVASQEREQRPAPAYALSRVRAGAGGAATGTPGTGTSATTPAAPGRRGSREAAASTPGLRERLQGLLAEGSAFRMLGGMLVGLLVGGILFWLTGEPTPPPPPRSGGSELQQGPTTIQGVVVSTGEEGGAMVVRLNDGTRYIVSPPTGRPFTCRPGDQIEARVVPVRLFATGVINARGESCKVIGAPE